jgi:hypothetical protein
MVAIFIESTGMHEKPETAHVLMEDGEWSRTNDEKPLRDTSSEKIEFSYRIRGMLVASKFRTRAIHVRGEKAVSQRHKSRLKRVAPSIQLVVAHPDASESW